MWKCNNCNLTNYAARSSCTACFAPNHNSTENSDESKDGGIVEVNIDTSATKAKNGNDTDGVIGTVYEMFRAQFKEAKPISIDFSPSAGDENEQYGWDKHEYLDEQYIQLLNNLYNDWSNYIKNKKTQLRNDVFCVYGVPGSGKSRLLMEFRNLVKQKNSNILPIIITFNDKCTYVPRKQVSSNQVWKELLSRIAFSLFGDNSGSFSKMRDYVYAIDDNSFNGLEWSTIVAYTIKYINQLRNTKYEGIVLLVDEILCTDDSGTGRDMNESFLYKFRAAWDSTDLTRKQLSFVFTTLNSYTWITHETKRTIITYFLPHFGDKTVRAQIKDIDHDDTKNDHDTSIVQKAVHSSVLVNFRPRYLRDILNNCKNNISLEDSPIACLSKSLFNKLCNLSIDQSVFYSTFTNDKVYYNQEFLGKRTVCDLTAAGIVIPYAKTTEDTNFVQGSRFVPKISLIAILKYLTSRCLSNNASTLETALWRLMMHDKLISTGNSFEKFVMVFEAFRHNAMAAKRASCPISEYFKHVKFCNDFDDTIFENIIFNRLKSLKICAFDKLMEKLDEQSPWSRNSFLLNHAFWFGGDNKCEESIDGLIVYESNENSRIWIFFEPRGSVLNTKNKMTNASIDSVSHKTTGFVERMEKNKNTYTWFKNEKIVYILMEYKKPLQAHKATLSDVKFKDIGIWYEEIAASDSHTVKFSTSSHFGPTWIDLLSHFWVCKHY